MYEGKFFAKSTDTKSGIKKAHPGTVKLGATMSEALAATSDVIGGMKKADDCVKIVIERVDSSAVKVNL